MNRFQLWSAGIALSLLASVAVAAPAGYTAPRIKQVPASRPDWAGVWSPAEPNLFDPAVYTDPRTPTGVEAASFLREYPPYNAEWEAKYVERLKQNAAGVPTDPSASCKPTAMPRVMATPYPMEWVIEPNRVVLLHENSSQVRRIWTDGRGHPSADDLDPTYEGHSIGHWEGDTLVVDTVGMRGDTVYDVSAAPHSDQVHVVERISRISPTKMEDLLTVTDPIAFTRPWVVRRTYDLKPDWTIIEYFCADNNRNPINADGSTGFLRPAPK